MLYPLSASCKMMDGLLGLLVLPLPLVVYGTALLRMPAFCLCESLSCECMFLCSLSRHNKDLEQRTLKPSAHHSSRVLDKPCYSSQANQVTAPFYLEDSRRIQDSKRREWRSTRGRERESDREREREREKGHTHVGEREGL